MLKFFILACLVSVVLGNFISLSSNDVNEYIAGGKDANISQVPYLGSLIYRNKEFRCAVSIVSSRFVVTAAFCVYGDSASDFIVRTGSTDPKDGGIVSNLAKIHSHPSYNPETNEMDVAVLEFKKPITYSYIMKPIILATKEPSAGSKGKISGWGLHEEGWPAKTLQVAVVPVVDRETCQEAGIPPVTESMICAGNKTQNTCYGDIGGPLVVDKKLAGIISYDVGCHRDNNPGVYTNIAFPKILSFIKETARLG